MTLTLDDLEGATDRRPTPSEMEVLLHWWTMFSGRVLCVTGYEMLVWDTVPADDWWESHALNKHRAARRAG